MPDGGISYIRETLPCYAKMLVGDHTIRNHRGVAGYAKSREQESEQLLDELLPQFRQYFNTNSTNKKGMGYVLVRRAAFSMPENEDNPNGKNELQTFLHPRFGPAWELVQRTLNKQTPITNSDIAQATETSLELEYDGCPGVYVRIHPERIEELYIGGTKDIGARNHSNSPLYLARFVHTTDIEGAKILEDLLHDCVPIIGAQPYRNQRTRGLYRFPNGINGYEKLLELMRRDISIISVMRSVSRIK